MIRTAQQLARLGPDEHRHITIRTAVPGCQGGIQRAGLPGGGGDLKFLDHLQKKYSNQLGFLPRQALEWNIERGNVSLALENDEPAAYLLGRPGYMHDPHFGIIYQAAVSYDAQRRLLGTALVQHFVDRLSAAGVPGLQSVPGAGVPGAGGVKLIGLWCAQDIEANEFWNSCGFEAIAARHGSRRKGRVHIFWVGRTPRASANDPLRYPKQTRGGLMRERRAVYGIAPGSEYKEVVLPPSPPEVNGRTAQASSRRPAAKRPQRVSLIEQQRAFRFGSAGHICVVIAGATRYLPVAPFEMPDFTDLARTMVGVRAA
jgi:hypothetical protein